MRIVMLLVLLMSGCATRTAEWTPVIPANLAVPSSQVLSLQARATGVQIYECRMSQGDPKQAEWVFKAPEAELFSRAGEKIGKHYGGPTWESSDGSRVVGEVKARHDAPDPDAIPWLLLIAKSTTGRGVFGRTQSIQRVETVGGKAPTADCSEAEVGKTTGVNYKATYYFYEARP